MANSSSSCLLKLLSEEQQIITKLVELQEKYELPSEADLKKISTFLLGDNEEACKKRFLHMMELTHLNTQLIFKFAMGVPGFPNISKEDQISLMKACCCEVMILRSARKYDPQTDSIVFANNQPYTREKFRSACMGDITDLIFTFCRSMFTLKVNSAEYALLTAIVILAERPLLLEPKKVARLRDFYIETLRTHIAANRSKTNNYIDVWLYFIQTELRNVGRMLSEVCFSLMLQSKQPPPLLKDIWNIIKFCSSCCFLYRFAIKRETNKQEEQPDHNSGSEKENLSMAGPSRDFRLKFLSKEQEKFIHDLVVLQQECELSSSLEDFKKVPAFSLGDSKEDCIKRAQHILGFSLLTVQRIVEFVKRIPGFDIISGEDQITLLKACFSEVIMLKWARRYDPETDSIVFANIQPYTRENFRSAGMENFSDSLFEFCRTMYNLKVDNADYALLTSIVVFSERPCLLESKKLEEIHKLYVETLRAYTASRPAGANYFLKLLSILFELRALGNEYIQQCLSLYAENINFPPFFEDIWILSNSN